MTIRDGARQEAERRWTRDIDVNNPLSGAERRSRRVGFELGALWASEQADREPSAAEVGAAARALAQWDGVNWDAEEWDGAIPKEGYRRGARAALIAAQEVRGESIPDFSERG